jgi:hypothetical protein
MNDESPHEQKLFTVEQVNAMLPLVRAIARDLSELARDVVERRERLAHLATGRPQPGSDPYRAELEQVADELEKDARRLADFIRELRELGAEPKNPIEGLVDFPTIMDGRVVYLCWKLDEPEVLFWHELDAGFAGRQPLPSVGDVVVSTGSAASP